MYVFTIPETCTVLVNETIYMVGCWMEVDRLSVLLEIGHMWQYYLSACNEAHRVVLEA